MNSSSTSPNAEDVRTKMEELQARLDEMEARTKLIHPNFWTRAFAVYGHSFAAGMTIMIPFYVIVFLLSAATGTTMP